LKTTVNENRAEQQDPRLERQEESAQSNKAKHHHNKSHFLDFAAHAKEPPF